MLTDVAHDALLHPRNGIHWLHFLTLLDVSKLGLWQADLENNSLKHEDSLLIYVVLPGVLLGINVNIFNNFVDHEAHLHVFKLVRIVHAH